MPTDDTAQSLEIDSFPALQEYIQTRTLWAQETSAPSDQSGAGDPNGDSAVVRFTHQNTGAALRLELEPGRERVRLALYNPLDPSLELADNRFSESVAESHETIAEAYTTSLVTPERDTELILTGVAPIPVDEAELSRCLHAISAAAVETECLHRQLEMSIERHSNRQQA